MFPIHRKSLSPLFGKALMFLCALTVLLLFANSSPAQRSKGATDSGDEKEPVFGDFKGVRIGMTADETRKKLGNPRDKGVDQDFYMINDNEAVQVVYQKGAVFAISIDFLSGSAGTPTCKDVLGSDPEARSDGSLYKLVRYTKSGFWVSYNRTAGNDPTVTITMQKIP